jgi:ABC-type bacteriocin/lantibiotic exporter with double-glycine peptidase domain
VSAAIRPPVPTTREAIVYYVRLMTLLRPHWPGIGKGFVLSLLGGLLGMVVPLLSKEFIDRVFPSRDYQLMHVLVVGAAAFSVATALMNAVRRYYSQVIGATLSTAVSLLFFNHLQCLPIRFFDERRVGEILSRFGDLRGSLSRVTNLVQTVLLNGIYLVLIPPLLLLFNWKLALLAVGSLPVTTAISLLAGRVTRKYYKQSAEMSAEAGAFQHEVFSQIRTLKSFAIEARLFTEAREQNLAAQRAQFTAASVGGMVGLTNGILKAASTALFSWYAWTLILDGRLSLGSFFAFSSYLGYLTSPITQLAGLFAGFQQSAVTLGRAFEYLDARPEQEPTRAISVTSNTPRLRGDIRLEGVTFRYDLDRPVLEQVTLEIEAGSFLAIVGPSGAGKSSLLRLLNRTMDLDNGRILIDGQPIGEYELGGLRRQIAVVWQDSGLLRGSITHNLTLGSPDVDPSRLWDALRVCGMETFVRGLPRGLETEISEWGATVSGGQRQRIAIARALVVQAPILLLDEATSQVDVETEAALLHDLAALRERPTVIMVTHRVASASIADRICVLEQGRVDAIGNHSELLGRSDCYRRLVTAANLSYTKDRSSSMTGV